MLKVLREISSEHYRLGMEARTPLEHQAAMRARKGLEGRWLSLIDALLLDATGVRMPDALLIAASKFVGKARLNSSQRATITIIEHTEASEGNRRGSTERGKKKAARELGIKLSTAHEALRNHRRGKRKRSKS
jgi:hypothetical protein